MFNTFTSRIFRRNTRNNSVIFRVHFSADFGGGVWDLIGTLWVQCLAHGFLQLVLLTNPPALVLEREANRVLAVLAAVFLLEVEQAVL